MKLPTDGEDLIDAIRREQARLLELRRQYALIGATGRFAVEMMTRAIEEADQAVAAGNLIALVRALEFLQSCGD